MSHRQQLFNDRSYLDSCSGIPHWICLGPQHRLKRLKALGTKMVSEIVFILTVVLRVTMIFFTVCEREILHNLFIGICTAVHVQTFPVHIHWDIN
jgi:hypothetical protein